MKKISKIQASKRIMQIAKRVAQVQASNHELTPNQIKNVRNSVAKIIAAAKLDKKEIERIERLGSEKQEKKEQKKIAKISKIQASKRIMQIAKRVAQVQASNNKLTPLEIAKVQKAVGMIIAAANVDEETLQKIEKIETNDQKDEEVKDEFVVAQQTEQQSEQQEDDESKETFQNAIKSIGVGSSKKILQKYKNKKLNSEDLAQFNNYLESKGVLFKPQTKQKIKLGNLFVIIDEALQSMVE